MITTSINLCCSVINAQNVGISTITPTEKLEINGTTKTTNLQMTTSAANKYVLQSDSLGNSLWVNPASLSIAETDPRISSTTIGYIPKWNGTNLIDGLLYKNDGRVMTGTTNPDYCGSFNFSKLTIASNDPVKSYFNLVEVSDNEFTAIMHWGKARGMLSSPTIVQNDDNLMGLYIFEHDGTAFRRGAGISSNVDGTPAANSVPARIVLSTTPQGATFLSERMRITNSGNIGIGTTSPNSKLIVSYTVSSGGMFELHNPNNAANDKLWLRFTHGNNYGSTDQNDRARIGVETGSTGAGKLFFTTRDFNGQLERMRIDSTGNVGIGTSTPAAKLDITGNIKINDSRQGKGKALTSGDDGLSTWSSASPYYTLTSRYGLASTQSFPVSSDNESGAMVAFLMFTNCAGLPSFGGSLIVRPSGNITVITYATTVPDNTITTNGNIMNIGTGCGLYTVTFNVTDNDCTIATGGIGAGFVKAKFIVYQVVCKDYATVIFYWFHI